MKNLITLLVLFLGISLTVNAQTEKSIVKSFSLEASTSTVVNLPGEVELTRWDKDIIRVTAHIKVNFDENITKRLMLVGRYEIEKDHHNKTIVLTMPNASGFIAVKGIVLDEQMTFEVKAPKGYTVFVKKSKGYTMNS